MLNFLERILGRFAVRNLTIALAAAWSLSFIGGMMNEDLLATMAFSPNLITQGQWWRLFTFTVCDYFDLLFRLYWITA